MNKVFLIRHAESESNIGKVFVHQNTIKITQKGKQQAADLLEVLEKPNKIICSKYIRTVETAEPLMEKFPESEIHLWIDSHEFQPLDSKRNDGITTEQRNNNNKLYWLRLDPFYHDGGNSESFIQHQNQHKKNCSPNRRCGCFRACMDVDSRPIKRAARRIG